MKYCIERLNGAALWAIDPNGKYIVYPCDVKVNYRKENDPIIALDEEDYFSDGEDDK